MTTSDHELMARLVAGDSEALAVLVRRWESGISRVLARLVPTADVDDLRQEVFVRVLTASTRYRANGAFSAWLYRIVINIARDAARRRRIRISLPLGNHHPADRDGAPPRECSQRELVEVIELALAALPDRLREVLVLRHYGDLTVAQIAVALNKPISTIKSRTRSALRRLHAELARRGVSEEDLDR